MISAILRTDVEGDREVFFAMPKLFAFRKEGKKLRPGEEEPVQRCSLASYSQVISVLPVQQD